MSVDPNTTQLKADPVLQEDQAPVHEVDSPIGHEQQQHHRQQHYNHDTQQDVSEPGPGCQPEIGSAWVSVDPNTTQLKADPVLQEDQAPVHEVDSPIGHQQQHDEQQCQQSEVSSSSTTEATHSNSSRDDLTIQQPVTDNNHETENTNPRSSLRKVFLTRKDDLRSLSKEHAVVLQKIRALNRINNRDETTENDIDDEVVTYGEVDLSQEERELLNLGPGFMVANALDRTDMQVESIATVTKMRWGRRNVGQEDMTLEEIARELVPTEDERQSLEEQEAESRDVMDPVSNSVDLGNKRATDLKNNRSVHMPGPSSAPVEAQYETRSAIWMSSFKRYYDTSCKKDGTQKTMNLSLSQQLALKSLGKKISKGELVILEADKGKRFVATDVNTYKLMAADHTSRDQEVGPERVRKAQKIVSSTAKSLSNILGVGVNHSHHNHERCTDNVGSIAEDAPALRILPKVHKPLHPQGHPQSRPVVAAATGLTSRCGDILADMLTPLVFMEEPRLEDLSTEEALAQLEEAEGMIRTRGDTMSMVGSLDVKSLYPSLDHNTTARLAEELVMTSNIKMKNINYRAAQVFVACNMSEKEIEDEELEEIIPARKHVMGNRPGKTSPELSQKRTKENEGPKETLWSEEPCVDSLTDHEKRRLLSIVVRLAVINVLGNHVYSFMGKVFLQLLGGAIGLRLTSVLARIVMDSWARGFMQKIIQVNINLY